MFEARKGASDCSCTRTFNDMFFLEMGACYNYCMSRILVFFVFIAHVYVCGASTSLSFGECDYDNVARMCGQMELGTIERLEFKCILKAVASAPFYNVYGCVFVVSSTALWTEIARVMRASAHYRVMCAGAPHSGLVCSRKLEGLLMDVLPQASPQTLKKMQPPFAPQLEDLFPGNMAVRWQIGFVDQILDGCVGGSVALCPGVDGDYALNFIPGCAESSEEDGRLQQRMSSLQRDVGAIRCELEMLRSDQAICKKMLEDLFERLCPSKDADKGTEEP